MDLENEEQRTIFKKATHFNPVDMVCGLKNYKGEKYNLPDFVNYNQAFITRKNYQDMSLRPWSCLDCGMGLWLIGIQFL